MQIFVFGMGYVGTSLGLLLAQDNIVSLVDIDNQKVDDFNNGILPVVDKYGYKFWRESDLSISAVTFEMVNLSAAELVIIATPTDYDEDKNFFSTSSVEEVVNKVRLYSNELPILIKSTIPIGFTKNLNDYYGDNNILFSPEFLREGNALKDNLYPSRIIVGGADRGLSQKISNLFWSSAMIKEIEIYHCGTCEAEAIKLFTNTYLAMRVAFFNEVDSMSMSRNLIVKDIIDGICLDQRIGNYYNNPSFGFGGYCLPKDSKQIEREIAHLDSPVIKNINRSNQYRKNFLCQEIFKLKKKTIGIYKLAMKTGSDNYRSSAIIDIMKSLHEMGMAIIIFDPFLECSKFKGHRVISNIDEFKILADLVLCNRFDENLNDIAHKIFTRDIYGYL